MKASALKLRWVAALCAALLPLGRAAAQDADGSPFLPVAGAGGGPGGAAAAAANEPLELHGIMATPDGLRFCIFDAAKKTSKWVGLNDAGAGVPYLVKSADPDHDTVSVSSDGRLLTLTLRRPKVETSQPLAQPGGLPPGVSVVLNPSAADEQRRLQMIAAEVRRRRLLRQQADRQADQQLGGPPGPRNIR
jgi:hypothetical protein